MFASYQTEFYYPEYIKSWLKTNKEKQQQQLAKQENKRATTIL